MVFVCIYVYIGGIPLPVFSEWWLAKEKFSTIDVFIQSSFPGAIFQGCNGLSVKYQVLPKKTTPVLSSILLVVLSYLPCLFVDSAQNLDLIRTELMNCLFIE